MAQVVRGLHSSLNSRGRAVYEEETVVVWHRLLEAPALLCSVCKQGLMQYCKPETLRKRGRIGTRQNHPRTHHGFIPSPEPDRPSPERRSSQMRRHSKTRDSKWLEDLEKAAKDSRKSHSTLASRPRLPSLRSQSWSSLSSCRDALLQAKDAEGSVKRRIRSIGESRPRRRG